MAIDNVLIREGACHTQTGFVDLDGETIGTSNAHIRSSILTYVVKYINESTNTELQITNNDFSLYNMSSLLMLLCMMGFNYEQNFLKF